MANQEKFFVEYGVDTDATTSFKVPAGTTAQRDASPESGLFRYNTSNNQFEGYSNGSWGEIGGSSLGQSFDVDTFTGDNSTTAFTLGRSVSSEDYLIVFIDGVFQAQDAYTLSGTTLTLDSPPATGSSIVAYSVVPISVAEIPADTDDLTEGSTNLYFTNARVDSRLSSGSVATIETSGNVTVGGDLSVSGGLTVSGTTTTVNSTTTSVTDSMIELANSNTSSDVIDIGIYGNYDDGLSEGGVSEYTGLFRDASDSTWKLFDGLEEEPTTTVNIAGTNYAKAALEVGDLDATTITTTDINLENTGGDAVLDIKASNTGLSRVNLGDTDGATRGGLKYDHSNDSMAFRANGSDQMTLTNSGLGIGTTSPDNTLMVQGASTDGSGSSGNVALFEGPSSTNGLKIFVDDTENASGLQTISADHLLLNPHGGNVGIGISHPTDDLHIEKTDSVFINLTRTGSGSQLRIGASTSGVGNLIDAEDNTLTIKTSTAEPIIFETNDTEAMRINSSQNVGIGTTSPDSNLHISSAGGTELHIQEESAGAAATMKLTTTQRAWVVAADANPDIFFINTDAGTQGDGLVISSSNNVGIGTQSPDHIFHVDVGAPGSADKTIAAFSSERTLRDIGFVWDDSASTLGVATLTNHHMAFHTNGNSNERMRIDNTGVVLVNTTSTTGTPTGTKLIVEGGTGSGAGAVYIRGDGGGADKPLIVTNASNVEQFFVLGDGDVANTNNSYGAISDQSLKENIVDATDKLADLNQVQVRNFNLIGSDHKQIGVVAQELESVFPALVKTDDNGIKSVKYSVFVPILIKAVQEQQTIIDDLKARIETLENA